MTTVLESRLERLAEVLHAGRGTTLASRTRLSPSAAARLRAKRSPSNARGGMSGHTGMAERVAEVVSALHPDDLEALVRMLEERRAGD